MGGKRLNGRPTDSQEVPSLVEEFKSPVKDCFRELIVAGSYRRGKQENIGDVEIVFIPKTPESYIEIVDSMIQRGFYGHKQFYGLVNGVQFDVFPTTIENFGGMILHATGSGEFNRCIRYHAKRKGLALNQYGLFHWDGHLIEGCSEEAIFTFLGLPYIPPANRTFNFNQGSLIHEVASSDGGNYYKVWEPFGEHGVWSCQCDYFQYRLKGTGQHCKHILQVIEGLKKDMVLTRSIKPVQATLF